MANYELFFDEDFVENDMKLLRIPVKLCDELENGTTELHFKGSLDQKAVLCTSNETYSILEVETSNLSLLVPSDVLDIKLVPSDPTLKIIQDSTTSFLEIKRLFPSCTAIKKLLMESPFKGLYDMTENCYTLEDIINIVQMSSSEVISALKRLHAIEINGYWRLFDERYMQRIFSQLIDLIIENEWNIESIQLNKLLEAVENDIKPMEINHCLKLYLKNDILNDSIYSLDPFKLAQARANQLFIDRNMQNSLWEQTSFLETLNVHLPDSCLCDESILEGLCLRDERNGKLFLSYFPVNLLEEDPKECFNQLFSKRERWNLKDLEVYIKHLINPHNTQASLLLTYTRSILLSGTTGERVYSRR